jgi:hypothetical protein
VKRAFVLFMAVFFVVSAVGYLIWMFFDAARTVYKNRQLAKELDELEAWSREKKKVENSE